MKKLLFLCLFITGCCTENDLEIIIQRLQKNRTRCEKIAQDLNAYEFTYEKENLEYTCGIHTAIRWFYFNDNELWSISRYIEIKRTKK